MIIKNKSDLLLVWFFAFFRLEVQKQEKMFENNWPKFSKESIA